jgi:thiol-disulfide isomerase/thioredoxin
MKLLFALLLAAVTFTFSGVAADLSEFKTADELWGHIKKLERGPQERPQSQEEAMKLLAAHVKTADAALAQFLESYPTDARRWEAKLMKLSLAFTQDYLDHKPPGKDVVALKKVEEIATSKDAPAAVRGNASFLLIQLHGSSLGETPSKEAAAEADKELLAFVKEFPEDPRVRALKLMRADLYDRVDAAKSEEILKELATDSNPRVAARAKAKLEQKEIAKKPVELKFTAIDGATVDTTKLQGKVVLVDFWATWCGPCRGEVPNVVAAYKKFHEKGFEVIGISLDQDKDAMLAYTKEQGMTWPQYFDGKGWQNEISSKYGIQSIPAMWVLDKKGMIRSTNARGEKLGELIEKLLAE